MRSRRALRVEEQVKSDLEKIERDARRKLKSEDHEGGKGSRLGEGIRWDEMQQVYEMMVP